MLPTTCVTKASLSEPARVGDRPARSPSVGSIPSRAIGLPGIMFATLGVSPAGRLGANSYHPSSKVTNIPLDPSPKVTTISSVTTTHLGQISTPLLWNICSVASYQFVLEPLTNSYNQDLPP